MNDKQVDDIVAMLDGFMSNNGGHMNIQVDSDGSIRTEKTITKTNSLDCASGNMACKVPTLFEGMDNNEEEENHKGGK